MNGVKVLWWCSDGKSLKRNRLRFRRVCSEKGLISHLLSNILERNNNKIYVEWGIVQVQNSCWVIPWCFLRIVFGQKFHKKRLPKTEGIEMCQTLKYRTKACEKVTPIAQIVEVQTAVLSEIQMTTLFLERESPDGIDQLDRTFRNLTFTDRCKFQRMKFLWSISKNTWTIRAFNSKVTLIRLYHLISEVKILIANMISCQIWYYLHETEVLANQKTSKKNQKFFKIKPTKMRHWTFRQLRFLLKTVWRS